ncbi:MAG: hypothetical protein ACKVP7_26790 [Hyphomicrobiaceae bacterium]
MSKKDDWQAAFLGAEEPSKTKAELVCRADDLKDVLQALAQQIADADRRHSHALQEMQQRLTRLGGQTDAVKSSLPPHLAAAFDRIEDGMSQLAVRLAETEVPRQSSPEPVMAPSHAPSAPTAKFADLDAMLPVLPAAPMTTPPAASTAPAPAVVAEPAPADTGAESPAILAARAVAEAAVVSRATAPAPEATDAPPPLKSAIGLQPPGTWGVKEPAKEAEPTFVQNPDDPWDQHSAAALTQLYESGEAGLPPLHATFEPQQPMVVSFASAQLATPVLATAPGAAIQPTPRPAAGSPGALDDDTQRAWLDSRLTEIAARVERSLLDLKPDSSLSTLGERFDHFEQRFTTALDGVATRSDVEGLRIVEAHIAELSEQIEQTRLQLSRLDGIERQLGQLNHALSDEEVVRLLGGIVPTEEDLVRFAEEAASRVAARITSGTAQTAVGVVDPSIAQRAAEAAQATQSAQLAANRQMQGLQEMLANYMDERRRGEAMTADALETMQQAMQHVLDRVDAIEIQRPAPAAAIAAPLTIEPAATPAARPAPMPAAAAAPSRTFADEAKAAARLAAQSPTTVRPAERPPARSPIDERIEPKLDTPMRTPAAPATPAASTDEVTTRIAGADARPAPMDAPASDPAAAPQPRPATAKPADRQAFIAMARKAAEQAKLEADRAAAAQPKGKAATPPGSAGASLKERLTGGSTEPGGKGPGGKGLLLVACLAAVLLAGFWAVTNPRFRVLTSGSSIQQSPATGIPKAATINPAAQKANPQGPAIDVEATPAPTEAKPEEPAEKPKRRNTVPETGVDDLGALPKRDGRAASFQVPTAQPAVEHIGMGIAIEQGPRQMSAEQVMRARQEAHIASLSQRTAHDAARTSAVPAARLPAGIVETETDAAPAKAAPRSGEQVTIELPPAAVGPLSLRLAAAKGDASAQFDVAARFAEGRGVKQDFLQASAWYQRAATQGHAQSQYRLAALYERGLGVQEDPARARIWYKRAAEQGNVKAMHNLAVMSAGREGVPADYAAARHWFTQAAERGLSDSQFNLGVLTESGLGIEKDMIAAYTWFSLAARSGDKEALRRRDMLATKLEAQELAAGEAAVAQWRSKPVDRMANDPRVAGDAWKRTAGAQ